MERPACNRDLPAWERLVVDRNAVELELQGFTARSMDVFKETLAHKEFLKQFTLQSLHSRYRGSVLGFLWMIMIPASTSLVLGAFFAILNPGTTRTHLPWLLSGYAAWYFFVSAVSISMGSILGNVQYVTRIKAPKAVFPISYTLIAFIEFLVFLATVLVLLVLFGVPVTAAWAVLPLSILTLAVFTLGFCLFAATLNVFMRDVALLWQPFNLLWFLFSPIFYRIETVPAPYRDLLDINPIVPFLRMFQDPVANGVFPSGETILMATLYAAIMLGLGATLFARSQKSFYSYV